MDNPSPLPWACEAKPQSSAKADLNPTYTIPYIISTKAASSLASYIYSWHIKELELVALESGRDLGIIHNLGAATSAFKVSFFGRLGAKRPRHSDWIKISECSKLLCS